MKTITLSYRGPNFANRHETITVEVVRETKTRMILRLDGREAIFSRATGHELGTTPTRGIGREGYCLPAAERGARTGFDEAAAKLGETWEVKQRAGTVIRLVLGEANGQREWLYPGTTTIYDKQDLVGLVPGGPIAKGATP